CERDDQIGQRQEERVEDKKEPEDLAPQQEVLDNKANEKRNKTPCSRGSGCSGLSDNNDESNGDVEIKVEDLIDAHLGEIRRQEDVRWFEEPTDKDKNENKINPVKRSRWFPFKNKMVRTCWVVVNYLLLLPAIYNRNQAIMTVCDIQLPAWATIRSTRKRIRTFLKSQIKTETSPFGTPCFLLSIQGILS
ncbi:hypothetical protein PSHT_14663, partial [Puccinia striiformis]